MMRIGQVLGSLVLVGGLFISSESYAQDSRAAAKDLTRVVKAFAKSDCAKLATLVNRSARAIDDGTASDELLSKIDDLSVGCDDALATLGDAKYAMDDALGYNSGDPSDGNPDDSNDPFNPPGQGPATSGLRSPTLTIQDPDKVKG